MSTDPALAPDSAGPHPFTGLGAALLGALLVAVGGGLLANMVEDPELFRSAGLLFVSFGVFFLITGAVARGTEQARH